MRNLFLSIPRPSCPPLCGELAPPGGTLGRDPVCTLSIPLPGLSGRHVQLQCDARGTWWASDLGSRNGTWIDGVPLGTEPRRLPAEGRLRMGRIEAQFHILEDTVALEVPETRVALEMPATLVALEVPETLVAVRPAPPLALDRRDALAAILEGDDPRALRQLNDALVSQCRALEHEAVGLRAHLETLHAQLRADRAATEALQERVNAQKLEIDTFSEEKRGLESRLEAAEKARIESEQGREAAQRLASSDHERLRALEKENAGLRHRLEVLQMERELHVEKLRGHQRELDAAKRRADELAARLTPRNA